MQVRDRQFIVGEQTIYFPRLMKQMRHSLRTFPCLHLGSLCFFQIFRGAAAPPIHVPVDEKLG